MSSAPQFQADVNLSAHAGAQNSRDQRDQLIDRLRQQLGRWEANAAEDAAVFSCGAAAIDRLLPGGGLRHGMLVEWIVGSNGESESSKAPSSRPSPSAPGTGRGSVTTLGLLAAREACREGGALVVIDRRQTFYPPAAAAWGIDLDRLIVVHPRNARDELWAAVQTLRSPAVAAMWAAIDRLDSRVFRKLQLAAQAGRTLGVLLRPARAREEPSWADVTLGVETRAKSRESRARILALDSRLLTLDFYRRVQVQLLRCHNSRAGDSVVLEIDDTAYIVREAEDTQLSAPRYRPRLLADGR
jgi:hypothetical protein